MKSNRMLAEEAADKSLQGFHAIEAIHVLDLPGLRFSRTGNRSHKARSKWLSHQDLIKIMTRGNLTEQRFKTLFWYYGIKTKEGQL